MSTRRHAVAAALVMACGFGVSSAWAQQAKGGHDHGDHHHGEVAVPKTFGEAFRAASARLRSIEELTAAGSMSAVANEAHELGEIARQLGKLALAKDSGVARDQVKTANVAGKALYEAAEEVHVAADRKDAKAAGEALDRAKKAIAQLEAVAPATYFCPMHCEGDKTYAAPGKCPVCKMTLKKQTSDAYTVDVSAAGGAIEAGRAADLKFVLKDPRGAAAKELEIVHEQPLHLIMVSRDLSWFAHEHPSPDGDGVFRLSWTFPSGGEYTLFHDFTPRGVGMQVVPVTLEVKGEAAAPVALVADWTSPREVGDYRVELSFGGSRPTTGGAVSMTYTVTKGGKPVTDLEPYLGAMGHLVVISADRREFVHAHPAGDDHSHGDGHDHSHDHGKAKGAGAEPAAAARGPQVAFDATFRAAGMYKSWAQFQHGGRVITVPFVFEVGAGSGAGEHAGHDHAHPKKK